MDLQILLFGFKSQRPGVKSSFGLKLSREVEPTHNCIWIPPSPFLSPNFLYRCTWITIFPCVHYSTCLAMLSLLIFNV